MRKDQLRSIRKERNLTQNDFAARLGYSKTYIEKLERGEKPITTQVRGNVAKMLKLERAYERACSKYNDIIEIEAKALRKKHKIINLCFLFVIILFLLIVVF